MFKSARSKGLFYGSLTAIFFSIYPLISKYVYITYNPDPLHYTATMLVAAGAFGLFATVFTAKPKIIPRSWLAKALAAGVLAGVAIGILVFGQNYTSAINAGIITPASVLFTIIFAALLLKQKFPKADYIWGFTLFLGIYLAVAGLRGIHFNNGDLLILLSATMLGLLNVIAKLIMLDGKSNFVADVRVVSGGLIAALIGLIVSGNFVVTNAGAWPILAGLTLWLAVRSFYAAVHYIGPTSGIITATAYPVFTTIGAYFWLGEAYSWSKFIGSAIIIGSIILLNIQRPKKSPQFTKR